MCTYLLELKFTTKLNNFVEDTQKVNIINSKLNRVDNRIHSLVAFYLKMKFKVYFGNKLILFICRNSNAVKPVPFSAG